jgi:hypothetical protein
LPMLSLHDQSRGPWILLHVVSGPWTFFVAALDNGQCRKAVCRRYSAQSSISKTLNFIFIFVCKGLPVEIRNLIQLDYGTYRHCTVPTI